MRASAVIYAIGLAAAIAVAGCKGNAGGDVANKNEGVLARVDTATLTIDHLRAAMPVMTTPDDSVRWARSYIRAWIDNHVISQIATDNMDMTDIDRMVQEYRNQLILWQYRRQMFDNEAHQFAPDSVRAYYESHPQDFKLSRPLVRGTYLKLPDNSADLPAIRRVYRSDKTEDLDRLEKFALNSAIHYDYFGQRWVDWDQIEAKIPYDFGGDPDGFLRGQRWLDITSGGFTYLLYIKEYLPTGAAMPFEAAEPKVINRMTTLLRQQYDQTLRTRLYDQALADGRVEVFCNLTN